MFKGRMCLALPIGFSLLFSEYSFAQEAYESEQYESPLLVETQSATAVTSFLVSQAKSVLVSQARSWLVNQIFGSSGQPSLVNLHQESLDAIKEIIDNNNYNYLVSQFNTFFDEVNVIHAIAENNSYDSGLVNFALFRGRELVNDPVYTESGYPQYFTMTGSRAKSYALLLSVYVEKALNEDGITQAYLSSETNKWAAELTSMGAAADSFIARNIRFEGMDPGCGGGSPLEEQSNVDDIDFYENSRMRCSVTVYDDISGNIYRFPIVGYDHELAYERATHTWNGLVDKYRNEFKGSDFNETISYLEDF